MTAEHARVRRTPAPRRSRANRRRLARAVAVASGFLGAVALLGAKHDVLVWVFAGYVVMSAFTFLIYGGDKSAALDHRQRTPESILHTLALLGGWPGALVARQYYRHKTVKEPFRTVFWITVAVNCAALSCVVLVDPLSLLQRISPPTMP